MTNKQYLALNEVIRQLRLLQTAGTIAYVGEYPQDFDGGQNYPAVYVKDGNKKYNMPAGNTYHNEMEIKIYVYTERILNKSDIENMTDAQTAIINQLMSSLTLNGKVANSYITESPDEPVGNDNQISKSTINLNVLIIDTRT